MHTVSQPFAQRRLELVRRVGHSIILLGACETPSTRFVQESSFFYFTGLQEPGLVCLITPDGESTLFLPQYLQNRAQWMGKVLTPTPDVAQQYGFTSVELLGEPVSGYQVGLFSNISCWKHLLEKLRTMVGKKEPIGTIVNRDLWLRFAEISGLQSSLADVSSAIASMRRIKSKAEIDQLAQAFEITMDAHEAAAAAIKADATEAEVEAAIQYVFRASGADEAFPSIVATGHNATILHHESSQTQLKKSECVVVDIGAASEHYCADITRTYPVGKTFSKRQRELYQAVFEVQRAVADAAKPGMFLYNEAEQDRSLSHIARKLFAERKLDQYLLHGIGHFLGLDVHDVGNPAEPLAEGDVITIEPGIYVPEEQIGIRIEDDFWMVKNGSISLTDRLPKELAEFEEWLEKCRSRKV